MDAYVGTCHVAFVDQREIATAGHSMADTQSISCMIHPLVSGLNGWLIYCPWSEVGLRAATVLSTRNRLVPNLLPTLLPLFAAWFRNATSSLFNMDSCTFNRLTPLFAVQIIPSYINIYLLDALEHDILGRIGKVLNSVVSFCLTDSCWLPTLSSNVTFL